MPRKSSRRRRPSRHQGQLLVALAIALPFVLALSAYAVNLCCLQRTHGRLGAVVDAAAQAAMTDFVRTRDERSGRNAGIDVARANDVQNAPLQLADDEIQFGRFDDDNGQWQFRDGLQPYNAVRVFASVVTGDDSPAAKLLKTVGHSARFDLERWSIARQSNRDIVLVVDRSSSMAYSEDELIPPLLGELLQLAKPRNAPVGWQWCMAVPSLSKWTNVIVAVNVLTGELLQTGADEQVGLVSFADEARLELPLSFDLAAIITRLQQLATAFCGGMSDKEDGIDKGVAAVTDPNRARPDAAKILILISDSGFDEGDALAAAGRAAAAGVVVHTISYGSEVDQSLMTAIASTTGGTSLQVDSLIELASALQTLARNVETIVISSQ